MNFGSSDQICQITNCTRLPNHLTWISTPCSVSLPAPRPRTSSGRIGGWRGAIIPASIPGIAPRSRCTGGSRRRTRRSSIRIGGAPTIRRARRRPKRAASTFEFTGFDFSAGAHGPQAATFTELFAETLHPAPAADAARPEPGRRHPRRRDGLVRGVDARRRAADRGDAPGRLRRVPRPRVGADAGRALRAVPGQRQGAMGARPHGLHEELRRVRRQRPAAVAALRRVRGTRPSRADRRASPVVLPAGVAEGARLRIADRGHAGRYGGRNGDLYVTVHVQPGPGLPPPGGRPLRGDADRRARRRPRRARRTCRRSKGRSS